MVVRIHFQDQQLQYLLQSIIVPLNILSKHQLKKAKECKNLKENVVFKEISQRGVTLPENMN